MDKSAPIYSSNPVLALTGNLRRWDLFCIRKTCAKSVVGSQRIGALQRINRVRLGYGCFPQSGRGESKSNKPWRRMLHANLKAFMDDSTILCTRKNEPRRMSSYIF
ncbi:hypothetical protein PoB_006742400 [Plakobranchus ocellatus]|uniref:Uncharacterized protein n=1 Tax=Plakobranchus ocellatus TaxID=259542 RepID=A0AAV4D9W0_9GAST|nr:hypothetical protein PoB_006742400 [Plakobranchus ocellatus]